MHARVYRRSVLSADPKIAALAAETGGKSETPQMPDQLSNAFIDHGRTRRIRDGQVLDVV